MEACQRRDRGRQSLPDQTAAWCYDPEMAGLAIEVMNVAEQITSQLAWWIDELGQEYDLSDW
jgi:hypothetical protein